MNNQCLTACPAFFVSYTNPVTSRAVCLGCPANCISCSSAAAPLCLNCAIGFYLSSGGCVADCSSVSLYVSYGGTCAACQCRNCSVYSYACIACNPPRNLLQGQCITNCPSGYYPSSNICQSCSSNCLSCTSASTCQYCQIPYALTVYNATSSSCSLTCPLGTIATIDVSFNYVCKACTGNCLTCQISTSYCLSCQPPFFLNNRTCVNSCPTGYWVISGACRICAPACQACLTTDPHNCSSCASGYFYANRTCASTCPVGSYADISSLTCMGCNAVCSACLNSTNCTACAPAYYLHGAYCYPNCASISSLFYSYNGSCMICQPQCTTCLATPFQCSSCSSPTYFFNPVDKSCSLACSASYFINGSLCSPCQSPCASCDTLFDSCLSCLGNLSVFNGKCLTPCPSGYFSETQVCKQCPSTCLTCNVSFCFACQTYAYRFQNTCVADCQSTALPITIDSYCTSCAEVPYCQACQAAASSDFVCFLCVYPYVIF
jgi:proprotein convertase subtilisin/kexin type 5